MGIFLSDIVLQVLSFVAENERKNIKQRQREGIEAAKLRGVQMGRPQNPLPENFEIYVIQWNENIITGTKAAEELGMPVSTFYRKAKKYAKNNRKQSLRYE